MEVTFYAGAAEAAGRRSASVAGDLTAAELVDRLTAGNDRLARVMSCCSLLVDGLVVHDLGLPLGADCRVDVLPPFAGG